MSNRRTILTLCLGEAVYAFNAFFTSTAMPSAVRDLGGLRYVGWTVTIYLVAALVCGSATGFLKQKIGARRLLLAAGMVFAAGTLCAGAAPTMQVVLLGRLLQGAGEGTIAGACYALIAELLPPKLVPRAFGLAAIAWALAAFTGPLVAGALTELVSWRAAFLINLPIIAGFLILVPFAVPARAAPSSAKALPFARLLVIAGGILCIGLASTARGLAAQALLILAGLTALVLAFRLDRAAATRLFPRAAFNPATVLGAALWMTLLMPLGQASTSAYLPLAIQTQWGYRPTLAGAQVAVMALSWSGVALLVPLVRSPGFPGLAIRLGPLSLALGLAGAAIAVPLRSQAMLILCQVLVGTGFGLNWAFLNQTAVAAAEPAEQDLAGALVPTVQSAGYAIGAALAGLIANATSLDTGRIFGAGAVVALSALALGWKAGVKNT